MTTVDKTKLSPAKLNPVDIKSRQNVNSGDTVRVWSNIIEEKIVSKANKRTEKVLKPRLQAFEGIVICRKHGNEIGGTFTVRKITSGVGVERIFPIYSPSIQKIEIIKKSSSRRSKLYYLRNKTLREIKRKIRSSNLQGED